MIVIYADAGSNFQVAEWKMDTESIPFVIINTEQVRNDRKYDIVTTSVKKYLKINDSVSPL